jgi:hypothetical protein
LGGKVLEEVGFGGNILEEVGFDGNILEAAQTAVDFGGKIWRQEHTERCSI